jgi:hypothetical protein
MSELTLMDMAKVLVMEGGEPGKLAQEAIELINDSARRGDEAVGNKKRENKEFPIIKAQMLKATALLQRAVAIAKLNWN